VRQPDAPRRRHRSNIPDAARLSSLAEPCPSLRYGVHCREGVVEWTTMIRQRHGRTGVRGHRLRAAMRSPTQICGQVESNCHGPRSSFAGAGAGNPFSCVWSLPLTRNRALARAISTSPSRGEVE
jgi:hypothetical protein